MTNGTLFFRALFTTRVRRISGRHDIDRFAARAASRFGNHFSDTTNYRRVIRRRGFITQFSNVGISLRLVNTMFRIMDFASNFAQRFTQFASQCGTGTRARDCQDTGRRTAHFNTSGFNGTHVFMALGRRISTRDMDFQIFRWTNSVTRGGTKF